MYDLGLEFLRVYDGKFNFREGHTVRDESYASIVIEQFYLVCDVISKENVVSYNRTNQL